MSAWSPPADEELTWFRAGPPFPERPRPLEFTLDVAAFSFGASRALESLYFPLYELRAKLFDGWLYFAAAPSALAERDLEAQARRRLDSALRFTRDIRGAWERATRKEIETYNAYMETVPSGPEADLARLKRTRANQWFAFIRAVVAPAALTQQGIGETPVGAALEVVAEARQQVVVRGTAALEGAVRRLGLAYGQRTRASGGAPEPNDIIGPLLAADAPRMYLVREILGLLSP
ncbi:MAG TPA: hypothetical protein VF157_10805 [Chloroflexota bacterium]